MTIEVTARRVTIDDDGAHDWVVTISSPPRPDHRLILEHVNRDQWPAVVRNFGIVELATIEFSSHQERARFALDCDLLGRRARPPSGEPV